jgi:hypothetical protein
MKGWRSSTKQDSGAIEGQILDVFGTQNGIPQEKGSRQLVLLPGDECEGARQDPGRGLVVLFAKKVPFPRKYLYLFRPIFERTRIFWCCDSSWGAPQRLLDPNFCPPESLEPLSCRPIKPLPSPSRLYSHSYCRCLG